jgi:F-type H+-transporting ATPase subunit beta
MKENIGKVVQVMGPVVDIRFEDNKLPELLNAIKVEVGEKKYLTVEVAQHIGDDVVRCISMGPTEGLTRGLKAYDTFAPIEVPVGQDTLGRMFNVLGEPIDGLEELKKPTLSPIHRPAPSFKDQATESVML